jgi:hypothetical protein
MTYLDAGYNQFLQRNLFLTASGGQDSASLNIDSQFSEGILADNITGGQFKSKDGSVILNLEEGFLSISANGAEKLRFGNQSDGSTGLVVVGTDNKVIMRFTDKDNWIRSPDGCTTIEFDLNRITVRENDETGPIRVLLGYDPAGF